MSDEIHCDLIYSGARHVPTITAAPEIADRLITCVAATKTFNIAGAHVGGCVTSNADFKKRLDARIMACGVGSYNGFGMLATEAAWRTGEAWLDELLPYLEGNRDMLARRIEAAAPGARSMRLDGTYLAWVDFAGTGLSPEAVAERVERRRTRALESARPLAAIQERSADLGQQYSEHVLDATDGFSLYASAEQMAGVPAERIGWVSRAGRKLGPDLICPETGERYKETADGRLELVR